MAAKKKTTTKTRTRKIVNRSENREISYRNYEFLAGFLSDRAKIYDRKQTGFSAKTQRKLSREIKRARHLGLLPFKASI